MPTSTLAAQSSTSLLNHMRTLSLLEHVARLWRRHESRRVPQMLAGIDYWRVAEDKTAGGAPLERVHHLRHADRAANRVAALEAHLTRLLLADDAHSGGVGRRRR